MKVDEALNQSFWSEVAPELRKNLRADGLDAANAELMLGVEWLETVAGVDIDTVPLCMLLGSAANLCAVNSQVLHGQPDALAAQGTAAPLHGAAIAAACLYVALNRILPDPQETPDDHPAPQV